MGSSRRPVCGRPVPPAATCTYDRMKGKPRCRWHWLLSQPIEIQIEQAVARRERRLNQEPRLEPLARVAKNFWPEGERWCAGCQSFVPLFYCTDSRCRACASAASHGSRIQSEYGISREDYEALLEYQEGRCYICRRKPQRKRLAVDHDHRTGEVRGLLCANNENGCNRAVVANLEAAIDGGVNAARRALEYLQHPPFARLRGQEAAQERPAAPPRAPGPPPF